MIKILSIQEAYKAKIERQLKLKGLKYKCHGSCAYIGKEVSPGCYGCFYPDAHYCGFILGRDFRLPNVCNRDCVYCFESHQVRQTPVLASGWQMGEAWKQAIIQSLMEKNREL